MGIINIENIKAKQFGEGIFGKVIHTDNMTVIYWEIKADSKLPEHSHPNEQITQLTSGKFELTVENKKHLLQTNKIAIIPKNVKHSGKAFTDCKITDVFYPVRKDLFINKTK